jgi:hypothetical protein
MSRPPKGKDAKNRICEGAWKRADCTPNSFRVCKVFSAAGFFTAADLFRLQALAGAWKQLSLRSLSTSPVKRRMKIAGD